ncbi:alpha/beta fold hydrolase [Rhodovastum sp. RN2-1]|uniref:Alpha/beta fold hydrolase n=2 Tax=Limobrevibacterium gyesilva TaxID=2991712 RepID=A0AA42CFY9_9PROT|nr:alpha/beta fold hydrolase [Limobrevibacterium gyesilva]
MGWRAALGAAALLLLAGCATPVQVQRRDPRDVQRELTSTVISTGELSGPTQVVLHRQDLSALFDRDPEAAIAILHRTVTAGQADADALFALAEMSFQHAEQTGRQPYYLAASVYAFVYLFPADPARRPDPFDPRLRAASDIYNRGLTSGFASPDRSRVRLRSGRFELPFGSIDITFDAASVRWGNLVLSDFTPADELHVIGLQNRYRRAGIGAPLAASATAPVQETGFRVAAVLKVPVTALLRIDLAAHDLAQGRLSGSIEVYPAFEPSVVEIRGQQVPLEADTTAALAYGLSNPKIWRSEFAGFLQGDFFARQPSQLVGVEPYRRGQIPVVFIHGTGSSAGRWGDMLNDLQADPVIREHFQFWVFFYSTGNPVPYSALQLRTAIEDAVRTLDPQGTDPALRNMVLVGHSQGGLLAKMLVIDSGSRVWDAFSSKPLDQMRVSPETRALLQRAVFVKPLPEVRRVIFIATPHRGSFVAGSWVGRLIGRLVTMPLNVANALAETAAGYPDELRVDPRATRFGSVWSMSPGNPGLQALAAIPVSPEVAAHSIIAVQGNGPVETGDDGVVTYRSAHLDGVASELVVRSGHSVQANPRAVAEVRRILLLHLAESCPQGCALALGRAAAPAQ